jgi:hypothetical protein
MVVEAVPRPCTLVPVSQYLDPPRVIGAVSSLRSATKSSRGL